MILSAPVIQGEAENAINIPPRAQAISRPIASAISFPLNHFTMIRETVIPAISTPTPNKEYPIIAIFNEGL